MLQYRSIFGTVRTTMLKNKIIFYSISLSSFMTLSSLSFFSSFFPRLTSSSQFTSFPFISSSFFLQNLNLSFFLAFFSPFFSFLLLSMRLLYLFFSLSLSFSVFFFFPPPKPLPLRSAVTMEFGLAVEFSLADEAIAVEISNSDLPLFFFPSVVDSM